MRRALAPAALLAATVAAGLAPAAVGATGVSRSAESAPARSAWAGSAAVRSAPGRSAASAAPRIKLLVVGRTRVLRGPLTVLARARTVRAGARTCAVAAGTPIAALAALRTPTFAVRDYGACSARDPRASELLYVRRVAGDAAHGADGWVFKVGRRALDIGGANPRARVPAGGRVLWFYCRKGAGGCQRTLEIFGPARAAPGVPVLFTVRGYDDRARGTVAAGARVTFAGANGTTAADGTVSLPAPARARVHRASANATGLVPSFPLEVRVG